MEINSFLAGIINDYRKKNTQAQREKTLELLAYELTMNHYNVSLAKANSGEVSEQFTPGFKKIFGDKLKYKGFSRNILIVGAGASTNAFKFFQVVGGIVEFAYKELGLEQTFKQNPAIWRKFSVEASALSKHFTTEPVYRSEILERIQKNLTFEENLKLLTTIVPVEDLARTIKMSVIGETSNSLKINTSANSIFDYLPSLFYEIVAHLFKHRYLDVIINMNFDEMLDSAIEDEMGASTYHKIVNDEDCIDLEDIVDEERLRIPIYIKPHGTMNSLSSLRFTTDRYINHPAGMSKLLSDLFSGKVSKDSDINGIKNLNIILAGYSMSDIDIQTLVFTQLVEASKKGKTGLSEIKIFIFARSSDHLKNFFKKFLSWIQLEFFKKLPDEILTHQNILDYMKSSLYFVSTEESEFRKNGEATLGVVFSSLYSKIQDNFRGKPFTVKNLVRHKLLSSLFNKAAIEAEIDGIFGRPELFLRQRAIFHCLYCFVKFKGRVPMNEILKYRTGKYQLLYFNIAKKQKTIPKFHGTENPISFLQTIFGRRLKIEVVDDFVLADEFYQMKKDDDKFDKILDIIVTNLLKNSYPCAEYSTNSNLLKRILIDDVMHAGSKEIGVIYNDTKHARFFPFRQENVISTNLEFTWRFFDFATRGNWKKLCLIGDTGRPIFNLSAYADQCYLEQFRDKGKQIYLLRTNEDPVGRLNRGGAFREVPMIEHMDLILNRDINSKKPRKLFFTKVVPAQTTRDKMAVFLNDKDMPVFGIYYFRPNSKARINPVYFDLREDKNQYTQENLELLFNIFKSHAGDWFNNLK